MLAGEQALAAGVGDHRAIVGAEARAGVEHLPLHFAEHLFQAAAQRLVGADAAGDHQVLQAGLLQGATALDQQGLDHRGLERQGDVTAGLLAVVAGLDATLPGVQGKGLEPAEAEVQAGAIGHRPREHEAARSAELRQAGDFRTAGIAQADQLGGLVEGFAGGVVHRFAKQLVATDAVHPHQLGVTAGNQQGDEREPRRLLFQHRRQQVPFHVVHADRRHAPGEGHRLGTGSPHQQGADQAGTGGIGDRVDIRRRAAGLVEHLADQRQHALDVVARGRRRDGGRSD